MRRKEIAEIRKQFSLEKCNITRIDTSLITQGEITTRQQQTFLNMDDDDILKYLGIFKKTLSGKLGKNLLNLKFRAPEPEMSWGFLQQIRDSGLKDEDLIVLATESIKKNLNLENNWYIIWVRGVYDVPRRAKDGAELEDSEDVYDYIMCCICPMKLTKAALGYNEEKDQVNSRQRDWAVENPEYGFLFPAFDNREENSNAMLYYAKNSDDTNEGLIKTLGLRQIVPPRVQWENFWCGAREIMKEKWGFDAAMSILDGINEAISEDRYTDQEPKLTANDIKSIMRDAGAAEEEVEKIEALPPEECQNAEFLTDSGKIKIVTKDITVTLEPENSGAVRIEDNNGEQWISVKVEGDIQINGVSCKKEEKDGE